MLLVILVVLMMVMLVAKYKYYQLVETFEPAIWQQLGSPRWLKVPFVFISKQGKQYLSEMTHPKVCQREKQYRITLIC
ncbi:hypothetical protein WNY63_10900 [Pseudoalteromonas neustonica]|uniref:Uncharacterized protein n=1 Tax=Pseudoalteromonas neustonica TaxID=1840331 RepID=A0ABU9U2H0_9GAMM